MEDFEELRQVAARLKSTSEGKSADFSRVTSAIEDAVKSVAKSFSGSWLGYHSRVYYEGFQPPPRGAPFSVEWGFEGGSGFGTRGAWIEYSADDVKSIIMSKAGDPNLKLCETASENAREIFDESCSTIKSIFSLCVGDNQDKFLESRAEKLKDLTPLSEMEIIEQFNKKSYISRDEKAYSQGITAPEHVKLLAKIISYDATFTACREAAKIAVEGSYHLERLEKKRISQHRDGTKIFIGHGRSHLWRELKDFLQERLSLPFEEFNRESVAGRSNVERLKQMLDNSAFALLILTAEDETAEGKHVARMNVVHEVGLSQGRLGFEKAIILLEEGCEKFSNIDGLGHIQFPKGDIKAAFEEIRRCLEHNSLLKT